MAASTTTADSLVTTSAPTGASKGEPVEILNSLSQNETALGEVIDALSHVPLPTATNNTPAAGYPGELISSTVLVANTVSLTTATPANITSITLTPGDWEVTGNASFVLGSATCTALKASTGTATATHGLAQHSTDLAPDTTTASATLSNPIPTRHIQVAAAATQVVYLVATATFSAGTVTGHGTLSARRAS